MVRRNLNPEPAADPAPEIAGLRLTRQRREVYEVLMGRRDHPTAHDVFMRVRERVPQISLATVYNCLDALVHHGVVRQVNFEREPSRFCPNLEEHGHFHDRRTGAIHDIGFRPGVNLADLLNLPQGAVVTDVEITLRGELPSSPP